MTIEFDKKYLEDLFKTGKTDDRKHRLQPEIVRAYRKTVLLLMAVRAITDLFVFNGLNYEALHGDKERRSSVMITKKYRLEFTVREEAERSVLTICTLLDIRNHYD